jgi:hypothetical protein
MGNNELFLTVAMGALVFGLLALVLVLKEQRKLKNPATGPCRPVHTCQCQGKRQVPSDTCCPGNHEEMGCVSIREIGN